MKDFIGNELKVGDEVVCIELDYKNLKRAVILKITPKTVFVEYQKWGSTQEVKRSSNQVVKI